MSTIDRTLQLERSRIGPTSFQPSPEAYTSSVNEYRSMVIFENDSRYEGQWKVDTSLMHGWGVYCNDEGNTLYEGFWKDGVQHGKGREICSGDLTYEGDWKNGLMDGQGVMEDKNTGQKYEGCFITHCKEGTGTITESWGGKIYGQFYKGEFNGICTYSHAG